MKGYLGITRNIFMSELTYRSHFITSLIIQTLAFVVTYFLWRAVYAGSGGTINGVTFESAYIGIVLTNCLLRCISNEIEWEMCFTMQNGDIIIPLVRPTDYMKYMFFTKCGSSMSSITVYAIPTVIVLIILFPKQFYINWNILFFIICVSIAFVVMFFLEFILGVITFYTQSVWGLSTVQSTVISFFAGAQVPLSFFPKGLGRLADILPFKVMYNMPMQIITDRSLVIKDYLQVIALQIVWAIALFILARFMFGLMKKKIVINGG